MVSQGWGMYEWALCVPSFSGVTKISTNNILLFPDMDTYHLPRFLSFSIIIIYNRKINTNQRHKHEGSKEMSSKTPKFLVLLGYPIIQFPPLTCENKVLHLALLLVSL